jgi:hypothetical protein
MKVGDMVKINLSRVIDMHGTYSPEAQGVRDRVGKVGFVVGFSKNRWHMSRISVQWLDTQIVTIHNKFFVEVINESR